MMTMLGDPPSVSREITVGKGGASRGKNLVEPDYAGAFAWAQAIVQRGQRLALVLRAWRARARTRHQLLRLNERLLRDVGITSEQAQSEGQKPFWR